MYALIAPRLLFARAAAINRIKTRLEELQSQISLVLALDRQLREEMRLTQRDISSLLGPWVRLQSLLATGMPVRLHCCLDGAPTLSLAHSMASLIAQAHTHACMHASF